MLTNSQATTILCFGDSNTHGQTESGTGRYSADVRWTGQLQKLLGSDYDIIEEGLGGRTTNLEHPQPNPEHKPRNGFTHYHASLGSHLPLAGVIIMLGTNDLKTFFHRSAQEVAQALAKYVPVTQQYAQDFNLTAPRILFVSPIYISGKATGYYSDFDASSITKSQELAGHIQTMAKDHHCAFFDAAGVAQPGNDGLHMAADGHAQLAAALQPVVRSWLQG